MRAAETAIAGGSPFLEVIMKKHTFFLSAVFFTAVFAAFVFSACGELNNVAEKNEPGYERFLPPLPPAADRETITEADIFGNYDGDVIPVMNNARFPSVQEKIRIKKSSTTPPTITFITREQTPYQKIMHNMGLSYTFKEITLVPAADGKAYFFSGTGGKLYLHNSPTDTTGEEVSTNTALEKGSIYKKGGKLYISYIVVYDMADIRKTIPLLPENHKSLVAVMQKGEKK